MVIIIITIIVLIDTNRNIKFLCSQGGKPWILVNGMFCKSIYYLVPESDIAKNWNYKVFRISEKKVRHGGIAALDFDQDGFTDLFVSISDENVVRVYSFMIPNKTTVDHSQSSPSLNYGMIVIPIMFFVCFIVSF